MRNQKAISEHSKTISQLNAGLGAVDYLSDLAGAEKCIDETERAIQPLKVALELGKKKIIAAQARALMIKSVGLKEVEILCLISANNREVDLSVLIRCKFESLGSKEEEEEESTSFISRECEVGRKFEEFLYGVDNACLLQWCGVKPISSSVFLEKLYQAVLGPEEAAKWMNTVEASQMNESKSRSESKQ